MSDGESSSSSHQTDNNNKFLCQRYESSEDEDQRLKRREKNRVAAQKSRKRQMHKADLLHDTCEYLEQRNRKLKKEVDSLCEEQRLLTDALSEHEPSCPIMHCSTCTSTSTSLSVQPGDMATRSV
ncbi:basic leucine zipper transcriptional factor ATF-like 3 [Genypterus blacodes]|uniref:basic leucine zipper transcriptional factor ATF-like 3 n=1 Tax=Genypterus blacodes TaxID=154954 RepID=UPI003F75E4F2